MADDTEASQFELEVQLEDARTLISNNADLVIPDEAVEAAVLRNVELEHRIANLERSLDDLNLQYKAEVLEKELKVLDLETQLETVGKATQESEVREIEAAFASVQDAYVDVLVRVDELTAHSNMLENEVSSQNAVVQTLQREMGSLATVVERSTNLLAKEGALLEEYEAALTDEQEKIKALASEKAAIQKAFEDLGTLYANENGQLMTELESTKKELQITAGKFAEASKFLVPKWQELLMQRLEKQVEPASSRLQNRWHNVCVNAANTKCQYFDQLCSSGGHDLRMSFPFGSNLATLNKVLGGSVVVALYFLECNYAELVESIRLNVMSFKKDSATIRWMAYAIKLITDFIFWVCVYVNYSLASNFKISQIFEETFQVKSDALSFHEVLEKFLNECIIPCVNTCSLDTISGASGNVSSAQALSAAIARHMHNVSSEDLCICPPLPTALIFLMASSLCLGSMGILVEVTDADRDATFNEAIVALLSSLESSVATMYYDSTIQSLYCESYPLSILQIKEAESLMLDLLMALAYVEHACELCSGILFDPSASLLFNCMDEARTIGDRVPRTVSQIQSYVESIATGLSHSSTISDNNVIPYIQTSLAVRDSIVPMTTTLTGGLAIPPLMGSFTRRELSPRSLFRDRSQIIGSQMGLTSPRQTEESTKLKIANANLEKKVGGLELELSRIKIKNEELEVVAQERTQFINKIQDLSQKLTALQRENEDMITQSRTLTTTLQTQETLLNALQQREAEQMRLVPSVASRELVHMKAVVKKLSSELFRLNIQLAEEQWNELMAYDRTNTLPEPVNASTFLPIADSFTKIRSQFIKEALQPVHYDLDNARNNINNFKNRVERLNMIQTDMKRLSITMNHQVSHQSGTFDDAIVQAWLNRELNAKDSKFRKVATVNLSSASQHNAVFFKSPAEYKEFESQLLRPPQCKYV